jgi:hypothetical protein
MSSKRILWRIALTPGISARGHNKFSATLRQLGDIHRDSHLVRPVWRLPFPDTRLRVVASNAGLDHFPGTGLQVVLSHAALDHFAAPAVACDDEACEVSAAEANRAERNRNENLAQQLAHGPPP